MVNRLRLFMAVDVLPGSALWCVPREGWFDRRPGSVVLAGLEHEPVLGGPRDLLAPEGPGQGAAVDPQRCLVAVVPGCDVPRLPGQVDPAGPIEVVEVDHHPHRGSRVDVVP